MTRPAVRSALLPLAGVCLAGRPAPLPHADPGGPSHPARLAEDLCDDPRYATWGGDGGRATYCEVRTFRLAPPAGGLTVDAGSDGAVTARGADTVRAATVQAVVRAWGADPEAARAVAAAVRIDTAAGTVRADGPPRRDWLGPGWWAVSYAVTAPRRTPFTARTNNGALRVAGLAARLRLDTNNGALTLDFPVTVQGRLDRRRLDLTLGAGGAPLRVFTNNGGVRLARPDA